MREVKPNQRTKITIPFERVERVIPRDYTPKQQEDFIIKALEHYNRYLQRQRDNAR